jgi:hypothetical protein
MDCLSWGTAMVVTMAMTLTSIINSNTVNPRFDDRFKAFFFNVLISIVLLSALKLAPSVCCGLEWTH